MGIRAHERLGEGVLQEQRVRWVAPGRVGGGGKRSLLGINADFRHYRTAYGSRAQSNLANVYDISPKTFGTFDLVMFFGVLYHLRHPLLALEKIHAVCTGTLLMQTAMCGNTKDQPMAEFHPFGITSGPKDNPSHDPTCFWFPNPACCIGMLEHVGFKEVKRISPSAPVGGVFTAKAALQAKGKAPAEDTAPWS